MAGSGVALRRAVWQSKLSLAALPAGGESARVMARWAMCSAPEGACEALPC